MFTLLYIIPVLFKCVRCVCFFPSFIDISTFLHNMKKKICEANKQIHSTLWHLSLIGFSLSLSLLKLKSYRICSLCFALFCFAAHTKLFRWIDAGFTYIQMRVTVLHLCVCVSHQFHVKRTEKSESVSNFKVNCFVDIFSTRPPSIYLSRQFLIMACFSYWNSMSRNNVRNTLYDWTHIFTVRYLFECALSRRKKSEMKIPRNSSSCLIQPKVSITDDDDDGMDRKTKTKTNYRKIHTRFTNSYKCN